jgi:hydrogenase nickel incorporation protein HypB
MCDHCGCSSPERVIKIFKLDLHSHAHDGEHSHPHDHSNETNHETTPRVIPVERDILQENRNIAERVRGYFDAKKLFALNLVSSPGSGKTTFLERTINGLKQKQNFYVIEGDQQTILDSERILATGTPVIQINTGDGCHLDAKMVFEAVKKLDISEDSILMIENVGNLVCPSLFDLGEARRVIIFSVTEGDDKPLKYPTIFHSSDVCVINKIDLLPYVDFNMEMAKKRAMQINHHMKFFEVSAKHGTGMEDWYKWLESEKEK